MRQRGGFGLLVKESKKTSRGRGGKEGKKDGRGVIGKRVRGGKNAAANEI